MVGLRGVCLGWFTVQTVPCVVVESVTGCLGTCLVSVSSLYPVVLFPDTLLFLSWPPVLSPVISSGHHEVDCSLCLTAVLILWIGQTYLNARWASTIPPIWLEAAVVFASILVQLERRKCKNVLHNYIGNVPMFFFGLALWRPGFAGAPVHGLTFLFWLLCNWQLFIAAFLPHLSSLGAMMLVSGCLSSVTLSKGPLEREPLWQPLSREAILCLVAYER